ncbi:hypothetical protein ACK2M2_05820 [Acinetobacter sp. TY1]|uniref:hypothetical protein n=1 Tax=Acinetobacter sp. TY1 TaxID=3387626 RepID=UPI003AF7018F
MKIRCRSCSHSETLNKELIVTLLGGAVAGFGFWAWVSFLFAGTGFAMPICIALVVGGPALVIKYGDEIVEWLAKHGYTCKKCGANDWMALTEEANQQLDDKMININLTTTTAQGYNSIDILKENFNTLYPSLIFTKRALKNISNLNKNNQNQLERIFGQLQYTSEVLALDNKVSGTDVIELGLEFLDSVLYIQKELSSFLVISIAVKNTSSEIDYIKENY